MEIELVYPVLVRRLKKRYPGNLYSILAQSDRFVITNRGDELRSTISSKAYADLARVRDYYGILGIRRDATHEQIEAAYNARGSNKFSKDAYETLISPEKRAEYDASLVKIEDLFIKQVNLPSFRAVPLGGGREVGRSSFYVRVGSHYVLIDAGIKMQREQEPAFPRLDVLEKLPKIEAVFVSHVHADHIAALNRVPSGVPIYMTQTNVVQLEYLSKDYVNKQSWTEDEREDVLARCKGVDSGSIGDLEFRFANAGHVPGSSMVFLKAGDDSVLYTGDINFEETQFETPARPVNEKVRALFIEGTYAGQGQRASRESREGELVDTVAQAVSSGKKVVIPAFAIGRVAEVCKTLDDALDKGLIPAVKAYTIGQGAGLMKKLQLAAFKRFEMVGADDEKVVTKKDGTTETRPASMDMISTTHDFKRMITGQGSVIIIGGSGFGDQGVAAQLVSSAVSIPDALVLLVGHQQPGSTGDLLLRAARGEPIQLPGTKGEYVKVLCEVKQVGLSAHASEAMLKDFVNKQNPDTVFLVHVDNDKANDFAGSLKRKNAVPSNLQVVFDYAHRGIRLMPYNEEDSAANIVCSCGMRFSRHTTATRHAEMESHKLVTDLMWYYFTYAAVGFPRPKDIKGSFFAHLPSTTAVRDVFVSGDTIVAEGKLTPEEIKAIETTMVKAGRVPIFSVKFVKSAALPIVGINYPLSIANITERLNTFLGTKVDTPVFRAKRLHPGIAGEYVNPPRNMLYVNTMTTDEEDLNLVLTHEIAHYVQITMNKNLPMAPTNYQEAEQYKLFVEGFAQYATVKLGASKKLLMMTHERGEHIPSHYIDGRKMYEDIEVVYGKKKAIEIALKGTPDTFIDLHEKIDLSAAARSELVTTVVKALTEKRIWKNRFLSKGMAKDVREKMFAYAATNAKSIAATEFAGWEPIKVLEEASFLAMADYLISTYQLQIAREDLKLALMLFYINDKRFKKAWVAWFPKLYRR
jgi:Cft2 family RNA processing exonuclease